MKIKSYDIDEVKISDVGKKKRSEIKDMAADMVVGISPYDISEFNPESSKGNRILNRAYKRYSLKKRYRDLENIPASEVHRLSPKDQEKWFRVKNNRTAIELLSGLSAVAFSPVFASSFIMAPVATALGIASGAVGNQIGSKIGEKIDERRHHLTDNASLLGFSAGTVLGALGGVVGSKFNPSRISQEVTYPRIARSNGKDYILDDSPLH